MNDEWQWNGSDWQPPSGPGSYDQRIGSYPTRASSGSGSPGFDGESIPPPPPPPDPSYFSSYGSSTDNPYGPPPGGSYPFAPSRQPRPRPWFLIPLTIVVLLCVGGVALSVFAFNFITSKAGDATNPFTSGNNGSSASGPVTIPVSGRPTIVIDRNAGAVKIQGVDGSKQVIAKTVESNSPLADGQILFTKSSKGDVITFDLSNVETVTVQVTVPSESDLNINTNGDDITVTGVSGTQNVSSNGGSLHLSEATLIGTSTIETNGGNITFDGSLTPESTDTFSTNPGSITIVLPANAAFQADITNNGGIIQSDFPGVVVSDDEAQGTVGQAPFATLKADSNGGTILLKKAA
jgi:hypothetical protein